MNYDHSQLQCLRRECELHSIDFTRAQLKSFDGGYVVELSAPLFDLGHMLENVPTRIDTHSPFHAEGEMLNWLLRIQRCERQLARVGRTYGMDPCQINRTPLTNVELETYAAAVTHRSEMARLQQELSEAIQRKNRAVAAKEGAAALVARYGTLQDSPVAAMADQALPNATVGKPRKSSKGVK